MNSIRRAKLTDGDDILDPRMVTGNTYQVMIEPCPWTSREMARIVFRDEVGRMYNLKRFELLPEDNS